MRGEAERPADEDDDAVLEPDEVPEVDEQPRDPGDQAAQPQASDVSYRRRPTDRREIALVAVAERRRIPAA